MTTRLGEEALQARHGARDEMVGGEASHCDHRHAAVLELLEAHLVGGNRRRRHQLERVKTEVTRLTLLRVAQPQVEETLGACALDNADRGHNLRHAARVLAKRRAKSCRPVRVSPKLAGKVETTVGGKDAGESEHAQPAVLQLRLTQPGDVRIVRAHLPQLSERPRIPGLVTKLHRGPNVLGERLALRVDELLPHARRRERCVVHRTSHLHAALWLRVRNRKARRRVCRRASEECEGSHQRKSS
mmetsp:Transcript_16096/g.34929  ORF Transcript_16096/g.34929 Transcript_16096/m.34929 type:complete len:244 (-) Transcript_16096:16-747(-)